MALIASPAVALTGAELDRFCDEPAGADGNLVCMAYMRGVGDGLYLADKMAASGVRYCPPGDIGIDPNQAKRIAQKYFRDHPDQLNRNAGALVAVALYAAFTCSAPK